MYWRPNRTYYEDIIVKVHLVVTEVQLNKNIQYNFSLKNLKIEIKMKTNFNSRNQY